MGHFKLKSKTPIENLDTIQESDFSLLSRDNNLYQWDYIPEANDNNQEIKPGVYSIDIVDNELAHVPTSFTYNKHIMSDYVHTKAITEKIDSFFSKLDIYKKYGVFPKRGILMHGSQGTGKSLTLSKAIEKYSGAGDTAILYWPTDKFRASDVKSYLKRLRYSPNCAKFILIVEDLGGVSVQTQGQKLAVEPSLLSILDNMESIFKVPTMVLATTNFPENLLENLANRPKRFDYIHKVGNPTPEARAKFLEFFSQGAASSNAVDLIKNKKFDSFSVAHIEEVVIRHELENISIEESLDQVLKQSELAANSFEDPKRGMGF